MLLRKKLKDCFRDLLGALKFSMMGLHLFLRLGVKLLLLGSKDRITVCFASQTKRN